MITKFEKYKINEDSNPIIYDMNYTQTKDLFVSRFIDFYN